MQFAAAFSFPPTNHSCFGRSNRKTSSKGSIQSTSFDFSSQKAFGSDAACARSTASFPMCACRASQIGGGMTFESVASLEMAACCDSLRSSFAPVGAPGFSALIVPSSPAPRAGPSVRSVRG